MIAGSSYFGKTILDTVFVVQIFTGNGSHPHNGVHRGTDIMAHTRKKFILSHIGSFSGVKGLLQSLLFPQFLQFILVDIAQGKNDLMITVTLSQQGRIKGGPAIFGTKKAAAAFQGKIDMDGSFFCLRRPDREKEQKRQIGKLSAPMVLPACLSLRYWT